MNTESRKFSLASGAGGHIETDTHFRITVMGAAYVGKTSIISQFLYDKFQEGYKKTVEDFYRGEYEICGRQMILDILDTSGSYEFPAMRTLSIKTSDAFILVYAVDDEASFQEVKSLRAMIMEERKKDPTKDTAPTVIVGNKIDIHQSKRRVSWEDAHQLVAMEWSCGYVESSAKSNSNIVAIFKELLNQAHVQYALSPAVQRRRQSMPAMSTNERRPSLAMVPNNKRRNTTNCLVS